MASFGWIVLAAAIACIARLPTDLCSLLTGELTFTRSVRWDEVSDGRVDLIPDFGRWRTVDILTFAYISIGSSAAE